MAVKKVLIVLDYDLTVIDGIGDLKARDMISPSVPEEIKALHSPNGFNEYMKAVFEKLHRDGISAEKIQNEVKAIPLVQGMKELFDYFEKHEDVYELIVISDSNTLFVNWSLLHHQLKVGQVYSNPARVGENGEILLDPYHHQEWCDMSTINLCKGR